MVEAVFSKRERDLLARSPEYCEAVNSAKSFKDFEALVRIGRIALTDLRLGSPSRRPSSASRSEIGIR
jgi:hypothetical protein